MKRERARMIALERDVAASRTAIVRVSREFAAFHFRFPVRTPQFVLQQLGSVKPMLDMSLHLCSASKRAGRFPRICFDLCLHKKNRFGTWRQPIVVFIASGEMMRIYPTHSIHVGPIGQFTVGVCGIRIFVRRFG